MKKGFKLSDEQKRKVSLSKIGKKRKPFSNEWKRKLGLAHIGNTYNVGKKLKEETKLKIGKSVSGEKNGMYGRKHTKEMKEKMRNRRLGMYMPEESRRKISLSLTGKKRSPETRIRMGEWQRGEKSHFWKGGIYSIHRAIRGHVKYSLWKESILKRDDYTCQECGKRSFSGNFILMEVHHHIHGKSFSELMAIYNIKSIEHAIACEHIWDINLGQTLCHDCHIKTENHPFKKLVR
ncbi:MAG: NUMOD3 domain-containing DNA-binding protein [Methanogenium sp.]|jgi:hypothetical protein